MRTIANYREIEERIGDFESYELRLVRELRFFYHDNAYDIVMVLDTEERNPDYRVTLRFGRVANLRIVGFGGGGITQVTGFYVSDMRDRPQNGKSWEILDAEHGCLQFLCESVEVLSVMNLAVEGDEEQPRA
jgi:hypothetical protein